MVVWPRHASRSIVHALHGGLRPPKLCLCSYIAKLPHHLLQGCNQLRIHCHSSSQTLGWFAVIQQCGCCCSLLPITVYNSPQLLYSPILYQSQCTTHHSCCTVLPITVYNSPQLLYCPTNHNVQLTTTLTEALSYQSQCIQLAKALVFLVSSFYTHRRSIVEYSTTTITTASNFRPNSPYYIIDKKDLYMTPINYGWCSIELCHCFCTSIHSFVLMIYLTVIQSKSLLLLPFFVNAPFIWNALPGSILCVLCHVTFR